MIIKRSGNLKTRGMTADNRQRLYTHKSEYSLPTPDFYSLKYFYTRFVKENRDMTTVDLLSFLLTDRE